MPIRIFGRRLIELYDAILSGANAEITVRSTLQRAAGFLAYNTNTISGVPQKYYAFQQTSTQSVFPMVDTTTAVQYMPSGSTTPTTLISKTQGKQSSFFGVGNYLYIGNQEFAKKWDGGSPQGTTNWGIAIGSINSAAGPNACGTGTDVAVTGGTVWANPGNITANDGVFATCTPVTGGTPTSSLQNGKTSIDAGGGATPWTNPGNVGNGGTSTAANVPAGGFLTDAMNVTNFGFSIPSTATIVGISATVNKSASGVLADTSDAGIFLLKNNSIVGVDHSNSFWKGLVTYGSSSDLWSTTWTPAQINSSAFGIQFTGQNLAVATRNLSITGYVSITVYYSTAGSNPISSDYLEGTNFGFALSAGSTVLGILVEVKGLQTQVSGTYLAATLMKSGALIGNTKTTQLPAANGFVPLGGSGDLWGSTFTVNDVNQSTFGVALQAVNAGGASTTWSVDFVRITIFGTGGPSAVVNAGAGSFSATQGFQYVFCYGNSSDGNISNPTPPSLSTGVFTNKLRVDITLTASTDPQVNQIRVFRTTDTGTGAVFFELPNSPFANSNATVPDTAADTALQVTQAVALNSLSFSPPPPGLVNIEWYAGRLWGSVGNLLYFSAGPDNYPMGNGNANWPPGNVFALPTTIVKNCALNGGNGMLIVTVDGVHIVQGISNPGFTVNKWLSDVGARQQNAVDTDGSNIYIFTSDRQFIRISAQGIEELSQNVSDQTDLFDPTVVYVCQHRSGSQDSRVFLTDGSTKWLPYNLMMGAWEPAKTPADNSGVGAIGSIEIQPGIWKLLKGSTTAGQIIQQRDINTFLDNGSTYSWNVVFGNIPLADPTQLANVESLVLRLANVGSLPSVGILPNDVSGTFVPLGAPVDEPPESNQPATGYLAKKYYLGTGQLWSQVTHFQMQLSFGAEPAQNEIFSWGIFPNQSADERQGAIPQVQGR